VGRVVISLLLRDRVSRSCSTERPSGKSRILFCLHNSHNEKRITIIINTIRTLRKQLLAVASQCHIHHALCLSSPVIRNHGNNINVYRSQRCFRRDRASMCSGKTLRRLLSSAWVRGECVSITEWIHKRGSMNAWTLPEWWARSGLQ
jgi:hypothetical protein